MRGWRRNLNKGELRIHESSRSLDRSELGKTEALGLACEDDGKKSDKEKGIVNCVVQEKMQVDGQVPVDLSRIIVTVSIEQPWPDKNV